jgi:hypothetical protein
METSERKYCPRCAAELNRERLKLGGLLIEEQWSCPTHGVIHKIKPEDWLASQRSHVEAEK